ncbi:MULTISPECIES: haloacid dehalogenase type II [Rhodococcus]|uniref:FMN hydrolase n=1 Tax=Rhodococcus aetherivorans TaxID=191292 RepID=A0ABQ0YEG6_9NOCA|nr:MULTISPECIES: haloacid dehalogenase type II [Rhodococcus]ETT25134.1 haloacid dehalogenase, type II [Rhodococcus rhodochrous ATCC 21198]KDE11316.1 haloacid dehalogenase [Rhodococcus aetherivorans]NGP26922.1 haloacid dehalogenase type II [Rhodococcus aetherivorans]PND50158.1 haloacid dehalogenase type II [Rhodococcus sp. ENV425]WKW98673.1 haloacid dehalogenase type II [Rhodococcus aetherivorans]
MSMPGVKALVFDVFGSVVDWRTSIARAAAPFLARHGSSVEPAEFADAWRARYQPAMQAVREGRRPFVRLDVLHRENLDDALRRFGIDPAGIPGHELDQLNRAWHELDPWPDAVEGLTRLKQRFVVAPLSNGNVSMMVDIAKRAGLPWDAILGAEVARAYKPMPEAYLRTADILGLEPGEVCMCAAHNEDLAAARACGLKTAFFARPTEHGPAQATDLHAEHDWDVIADDLVDLARRLDA